MGNLRYSIIYAVIRPEISEQISVGLIIVDGDTCKFESNPSDFKHVTDMIDAQLFGLFPLDTL